MVKIIKSKNCVASSSRSEAYFNDLKNIIIHLAMKENLYERINLLLNIYDRLTVFVKLNEQRLIIALLYRKRKLAVTSK